MYNRHDITEILLKGDIWIFRYSNQNIITLVSESMDMSNNGLVSVVGWCLTQGSATFQIWHELTFLNVN